MLPLDRIAKNQLTLTTPHRKGFHCAAIFSKKYINVVATLPVRCRLNICRI